VLPNRGLRRRAVDHRLPRVRRYRAGGRAVAADDRREPRPHGRSARADARLASITPR
jgi:hypothetical protein